MSILLYEEPLVDLYLCIPMLQRKHSFHHRASLHRLEFDILL
jgi:hypothetical protein